MSLPSQTSHLSSGTPQANLSPPPPSKSSKSKSSLENGVAWIGGILVAPVVIVGVTGFVSYLVIKELGMWSSAALKGDLVQYRVERKQRYTWRLCSGGRQYRSSTPTVND
ncbi:hypothetical protein DL96DRAFT_1715549 [Flagelloscypha sp. PMI_526]|nr:hypothetical protein DL96DRAFT_1715549 [Flagelloscypha sp. PMI_526]